MNSCSFLLTTRNYQSLSFLRKAETDAPTPLHTKTKTQANRTQNPHRSAVKGASQGLTLIHLKRKMAVFPVGKKLTVTKKKNNNLAVPRMLVRRFARSS